MVSDGHLPNQSWKVEEFRNLSLEEILMPNATQNYFVVWRTTVYNISDLETNHKYRQVFCISYRIHVYYIYLHLVDFYGKCRYRKMRFQVSHVVTVACFSSNFWHISKMERYFDRHWCSDKCGATKTIHKTSSEIFGLLDDDIIP